MLRIYDLVRIKELPAGNRHFNIGEAIISGRGVGGFVLFFKDRGNVSWYDAEDLELVKAHQPELLDKWEEELREWCLVNE